jgi:hypothetical protein
VIALLASAHALSNPVVSTEDSPNSSRKFDAVHVGSFDADAWNGLVFNVTAFGQQLPFAVRLGSKSGNFLDGDKIFDNVSLVGPHAPDESYAFMGWRQYPRMAMITLEWSRVNETTVVGRIRAPKDMQFVLEAYSPYEDYFTGE